MIPQKELYLQHLDFVKDEISLYKNEEDIWKLVDGINNTPGNLCLHICGNLNHFFGATIGKDGYIRDRDKELSGKNVKRDELIKGIEKTKEMITKVFDKLNENDLNLPYPEIYFGENATTGYVVSRLIAHLNYHLGQINYHRRILLL